MVRQGFYNFLMTPSESGEKVSQSKVPLVLLPQKACFHAFEGSKNLSGPYKITDHFKPKANNSKGPNEPGVVVVRKEEIETSSVLDESVTRPNGLQMRRPPG